MATVIQPRLDSEASMAYRSAAWFDASAGAWSREMPDPPRRDRGARGPGVARSPVSWNPVEMTRAARGWESHTPRLNPVVQHDVLV